MENIIDHPVMVLAKKYPLPGAVTQLYEESKTFSNMTADDLRKIIESFMEYHAHLYPRDASLKKDAIINEILFNLIPLYQNFCVLNSKEIHPSWAALKKRFSAG
eukprot:UN26556